MKFSEKLPCLRTLQIQFHFNKLPTGCILNLTAITFSEKKQKDRAGKEVEMFSVLIKIVQAAL